MSTTIPLTRGLVAVVDDADVAAVLAAGKWCALVKPKTQYAVRACYIADGVATTIRMHNYITGWRFVDHINGDGLDNRRANLRPANQRTNGRNIPIGAANTSGFKGVTWHKGAGKWMAQLTADGVRHYLGLFVEPTEAARAYDAAAHEHFGHFARPNFPQESAA